MLPVIALVYYTTFAAFLSDGTPSDAISVSTVYWTHGGLPQFSTPFWFGSGCPHFTGNLTLPLALPDTDTVVSSGSLVAHGDASIHHAVRNSLFDVAAEDGSAMRVVGFMVNKTDSQRMADDVYSRVSAYFGKGTDQSITSLQMFQVYGWSLCSSF
ncbi:MAG: hypothetical protein JSS82_12620 [Bacteroidetes bacterium]|nr:hypothetical protein [Bacteroidota bacterium]